MLSKTFSRVHWRNPTIEPSCACVGKHADAAEAGLVEVDAGKQQAEAGELY